MALRHPEKLLFSNCSVSKTASFSLVKSLRAFWHASEKKNHGGTLRCFCGHGAPCGCRRPNTFPCSVAPRSSITWFKWFKLFKCFFLRKPQHCKGQCPRANARRKCPGRMPSFIFLFSSQHCFFVLFFHYVNKTTWTSMGPFYRPWRRNARFDVQSAV